MALDPEVQSLRHLTVVGEEIYFVATEGFGAQSVWRSDGTSAGTRRVTPIGLRFGSSLDSTPQFTHAGHRVYFVAENSSFGAEIWATDGTLAGTSVVEDLYPGYVGSDPLALTAFQGALYFSSIENGYQHRALRRLDGPFTPSYPLLEVSFGDVEWIEATESALFFARTTESQGSELLGHRRDGRRHSPGEGHLARGTLGTTAARALDQRPAALLGLGRRPGAGAVGERRHGGGHSHRARHRAGTGLVEPRSADSRRLLGLLLRR